MAKLVRVLMSKPVKLKSATPVIEAARQMQSSNIGAVVVEDGGGKPCGILRDSRSVLGQISAALPTR